MWEQATPGDLDLWERATPRDLDLWEPVTSGDQCRFKYGDLNQQGRLVLTVINTSNEDARLLPSEAYPSVTGIFFEQVP